MINKTKYGLMLLSERLRELFNNLTNSQIFYEGNFVIQLNIYLCIFQEHQDFFFLIENKDLQPTFELIDNI